MLISNYFSSCYHRPALLLFAALSFVPCSQVLADDNLQTAKGIVFHDQNNNQKHDANEPLLKDVKVSNGRDIVKTNQNGQYELEVDNDDILFVIKPQGWRTVLSKNHLPRFYYIHKPDGSPELKYAGVKPTGPLPKSVDFALYPQEEPKQFKAIMFGDPQPRNQEEIDYIAHDVVEELIGTDASFGVTLGDIMFDNLDLFSSNNQMIALIGIPWYNVIGNHDINYDAKSDAHSDETFERIYGPAYYSFDYGSAHFVVLDDVEWTVPEKGKSRYVGGFGKDQMQFIRNDLAMIPKDQMVVLMMHIPLTGVHDRTELYRLIEKRPSCISISGHTHTHEHRFIKKEDGWLGAEPHHHIVNVTVSGSWWGGLKDERGIPHATMSDGGPNGYSILSFDGAKYKLDYKVAGRDKDYQMRIHAPELVATADLKKTFVHVNVFNGSERSKVEMQFGKDAAWTAMQKAYEKDPSLQAMVDREAALKDKTSKKLSGPRASSHVWKSSLPADAKPGTYLIHIRTTDMHGTVHNGRRVIRVE
ncbi:MAG: metallophosphoesterase [Blastopirellula sp.]|nr:MAG: metallophosphoesterase [Blastopirellula sp.]